MTVDPFSGEVTWSPDTSSRALTPVVLYAYDTRGGGAAQSFVLDVEGGNRAPVVLSLNELVQGKEGRPLSLTLSVLDPDGDPLAVWADNIPPGADFLKFIKGELESCSVLLAIIGREWATIQDKKLQRRRRVCG